MSLRPVEMQGSYPHSQKTGKIQEQMQQRFQTRQDLLAQEQTELERQKRKMITQSEETTNSKIRDEQKGQKEQSESSDQQSKKREDQQERKEQSNHPYKGKFIDFSG